MNKNILLIASIMICFFLPVNAGSLFVGTKVIYPGGENQPPKEKDIGTSLKASARGNVAEKSMDDKLKQLFEDEDYETILNVTKTAVSRESKVYKTIALFRLNRKKEAKKLAKVLLKDKNLSEENYNKLCEELEIDGPEDLAINTNEN